MNYDDASRGTKIEREDVTQGARQGHHLSQWEWADMVA